MKRATIALRKAGDGQLYRVGETHQRAKFSDELVEKARELREAHGLSWRAISELTGMSQRGVRDVCAFTRRASTADAFRAVDAAAVPEVKAPPVIDAEAIAGAGRGRVRDEAEGAHSESSTIAAEGLLLLRGAIARWFEAPCRSRI